MLRRTRLATSNAARIALLPVLSALLAACNESPKIFERTDFVMGTLAQLKVVSRDDSTAENALDGALAELQRIEALTTVHDETSDVSRINAAAPSGVLVDLDTDAVLALSVDVARRSGGAFDPVAGALIRLWGFPEHPAIPDSAALRDALTRVSVDALVRERDRTWSVAAPGVRVDLGGIAKGYGVDRAADVLGRSGACIVNAGGDLAVRGTRPDGTGWLIGVQDPRNPDALFLKLRLGDSEAVATSGDYQHYVEVGGVRYHHLLDPRTGWPARGASSATVIAPTCALADAWATAAFVLGPDEGIARLEADPSLEGVLATVDEAGELVLHETTGLARYRVP